MHLRLELLPLPNFQLAVAVEPREDPPEQTEARPFAPAVRIAGTCVRSSGFPRPRDQPENHVAEDEDQTTRFMNLKPTPRRVIRHEEDGPGGRTERDSPAVRVPRDATPGPSEATEWLVMRHGRLVSRPSSWGEPR